MVGGQWAVMETCTPAPAIPFTFCFLLILFMCELTLDLLALHQCAPTACTTAL